jgi:excisionase family DNA binding protein
MTSGLSKRIVVVLGPASAELTKVLRRLELAPFDDDSGAGTLWLPAERRVRAAVELAPAPVRERAGARPMLLTIGEAAAALCVGRSTLYEMIARRDIEVVHLGRAVRVPAVAVEQLVERLRYAANAV